jgi:nucleotide-binding universal stress UspA family protein
MTTFQKILVPTDFSPHSAEAISVAATIARAYASMLTLVYVFDPVPFALAESVTFFSPERQEQLLHEFEKRLAVTKRAAERAGAHAVVTRVLRGDPAPTIAAFAQAGTFDLIVMGTHGRTGIGHALIGSVAEKVVRSSSCPVLTVRGRGDLVEVLST